MDEKDIIREYRIGMPDENPMSVQEALDRLYRPPEKKGVENHRPTNVYPSGRTNGSHARPIHPSMMPIVGENQRPFFYTNGE